MTHTLCIDVGGTGLKAAVVAEDGQLVSERVKVTTPYPCPPERLIGSLKSLVKDLPPSERVSVGFPGLVRSGRIWHVPALTRASYGGAPDPALVEQWRGFDLQTALAQALDKPLKVANDADVQGCAVALGEGFEFVITLGTGVGTAVFNDGVLLPHMELSHATFRKGETYDMQLGNAARKAVGNERWLRRVQKAIESFDRFLYFDRLHIGGGNAKYIDPATLPAKARIVSNTAGLIGGVRLWELN